MTEITLRQTCNACPEQYDALDEHGNVVGYLRLRHGHFTVQMTGPAGEVVYEGWPEGDGAFSPEERDRDHPDSWVPEDIIFGGTKPARIDVVCMEPDCGWQGRVPFSDLPPRGPSDA